jgi:hypothetical protein
MGRSKKLSFTPRPPVLLLEPRGDHIHLTVNQSLAGADVSEILMVNSAVANRLSGQPDVKASSDRPQF